ncbi:MAG: hypothetical protein KGQ66_05120 [Acidobacteriota bacterium]|nr:hypothetical protein [Acidobacteriota bacterium]
MTDQAPSGCQVDGCDRRAAASLRRDDLPGPVRLCFTHTEDFRMNGPAWTVIWGSSEHGPVSVVPAPAAAVGRAPGVAADRSTSEAPAWTKVRSRLTRRKPT